MSTRTLLSASAGASKCRTVDVCDIFGDNSGKALYRLDGNANDESGNYHGVETAIMYGGGVYERGAYFSTSGTQYISVAPALFNFGTADYTLSCRIKFSTLPTSNHLLWFGGNLTNGANTLGLGTRVTLSGKIQVAHDNASQYISVTTLAINTEYHILCTRISGVEYLYINGILDGSFANTINFNQSVGACIGGINVPNINFTGYIDQSRVLSRGVTATEVATLYAECAPTSIVDNINPFEDGSLLNKCKLEGNATSLAGTSPTVTGTVTYGAGKFGQGITGFSVDGSLTFNATGIKTISMFIAPMTISGDRWIIDNRAVGGTEYFRLNTAGNYDFAGGLTVKKNGIPLISGTAYPTAGIFEHLSIELTTARNSVHIGNVNTNNDGNASNKIDHIELYNKILTPMEVACLSVQTTPLEEPMHSLVDPFKDGSGRALYRLDGNALDESGKYNGTPTAITYIDSNFGQQGVFNGTTSKVALPNLGFTSLNYSVSVWAKFTDLSNYRTIFMAYDGMMCAIDYDVSVNKVLFRTFDGAWTSVQYTPTLNTLYHFALTMGSGVLTAYVNGSSIGTIAKGAMANAGGGTYIGMYQDGANYSMHGHIDQLRIFNRALTAGEVYQLYTEI